MVLVNKRYIAGIIFCVLFCTTSLMSCQFHSRKFTSSVDVDSHRWHWAHLLTHSLMNMVSHGCGLSCVSCLAFSVFPVNHVLGCPLRPLDGSCSNFSPSALLLKVDHCQILSDVLHIFDACGVILSPKELYLKNVKMWCLHCDNGSNKQWRHLHSNFNL